jgi:hypothetical protein
VTAPSRATEAGRAYLDLRTRARADRRPVDELLHLYVLEAFLARLAVSRFADQLVLKGGVLLAAFGERRPTRDIDLQAQELDNNVQVVRAAVCEISGISQDDGVLFDVASAAAAVIRDEDAYAGVRVTMTTQLATARPHFHVDVNVGDPIIPAPELVRIPRLLGGEIVVRGYPLAMVHAEKIVTAVARGTLSTRWRDFADTYLLTTRHPVRGSELTRSIREVARHRQVQLRPLAEVLDGYGVMAQQRWAAWCRKQRLEDRLPARFEEVVSAVVAFADPAISGAVEASSWAPATGEWA